MDACPSDEDLNVFLAGEGLGEVGLHLRGCTRCQEAVERLSDDGSLRPGLGLTSAPSWDWSGDAELESILEALRHEGPPLRRHQHSMQSHGAAVALEPSETAGAVGRLGTFDVEAEVGRGGMGVVFRARDRTTGRIVALKVLHAANDDARMRGRFIQEVRAAAKVEHDHVVRLYATSDPEDRVPYFAMEYLAGPSFAERIREAGRVDPRQAAEIVAQVAAGLQAAHDSGLIHSDVKPANILLDPATGRAKISDFGLARLVSDEQRLSREGLLPGTPAYLSPEQARGESTPDPRTDVYSLGVTLYEALTGELPFRGEPHRIIDQVLRDEPRPPRVFNDAIPRDLETVCLKAMAKEPSRRYPTAATFADDLRCFLRGEPIKARPVGALERGWRWCRNNRRVASLTAITAFLLVALAVGSTIAAFWIARERSKAVKHADLAEEQARRAEAQRGLALESFNSLIEGVQEKLASRPGTLELRRSLLEIARAGLSKVSKGGASGNGVDVDERTLAAITKLGDIDLLLGRTAEAGAEFDQAARMAERVSSANPKSVQIRRNLAAAYDRLGDDVLRAYLVNDANGNYEKAYAIRRTLAVEHPEDAVIRRDLRISQGKLGDVYSAKGDYKRAGEFYDAELDAQLKEPQDKAKQPLHLMDLRFIHNRIGSLKQKEGKGREAVVAFREAVKDADALCLLDPENASYRRQRALAQGYLGTACLDFGDLVGAEQAFVAFRDDRKSAVAADPSDTEARRSLALAHQHLGNLATRREEFEKARAEYLEASSIFDDLSRRDSASVMAHKDRLIVLRKLAEMEVRRNRFDAAAKWLDRELEIQGGTSVPAHSDHAGWISEAKFLRELYLLAPKAIDDSSFARSQPVPQMKLLLQIRAVALARAGRIDEASEAVKEVLALPDNPDGALLVARVYALIVKSLANASPDRRAAFVKLATDTLSQAIRANPALASRLEYDEFLVSIRNDPGFKALLGR